jgi:formylglycine-generating enzyme required for sulfatase activity
VADYSFISYAHEDTKFALKLARQLRRRGVPVWLDQWHLVQNDDWEREITRAVAGGSQFIIILSPAALNSWVVWEQVQWALKNDKTIISVVREPCSRPEALQNRPCIDFAGQKFRAALNQLLRLCFPERELNFDRWHDLKQTGRYLQVDLRNTWRNSLRPLIWPGWVGPAALISLALLATAFVLTRNRTGGILSEPTAESLTVVRSTATPIPLPTPSRTRIRTIDRQIMIEVPVGKFLMGSSDQDQFAGEDEKPQRSVYVDSFWIDQTEVTNGQFQTCEDEGRCGPSQARNRVFRELQLPVVGVTWEQAAMYCEWAGGRLPTEAEWEKAARGTDGRLYPWGNEFEGEYLNFCDANCVADWRDRSADDGYRYTAPVGSYPDGASPYGVLDMSGNVWEWTADWYTPDAYAAIPPTNPTGPTSGLQKVIRGGSWYYKGASLRVARRHRDVPSSSYDNIGFRCVIDDDEPIP